MAPPFLTAPLHPAATTASEYHLSKAHIAQLNADYRARIEAERIEREEKRLAKLARKTGNGLYEEDRERLITAVGEGEEGYLRKEKSRTGSVGGGLGGLGLGKGVGLGLGRWKRRLSLK